MEDRWRQNSFVNGTTQRSEENWRGKSEGELHAEACCGIDGSLHILDMESSNAHLLQEMRP